MNLVLRVLTLIIFSMSCLQSVYPIKQSIRASKRDQGDTTKVIVTITHANELSNSSIKQKPISHSTFTKNTDGFAKKLYFDFANGDNLVTVAYSDNPDKEFGKRISQDMLTPTSQIVISNNSVEITNEPEAAIIRATVKIVSRSVAWLVVSGASGLTPTIANNSNKSAYVLSSNTYVPSDAGKPLLIYKDKPTKIYTKKVAVDVAYGQMTELYPRDIEKAGTEPIIAIDEKGQARILSKSEAQTRESLFDKSVQTVTAAVFPETSLSVWKVVSGSNTLNQQIIDKIIGQVGPYSKNIQQSEVLDSGLYTTAMLGQLKVYKNQDTTIYAHNVKSGNAGSSSSGKRNFTILTKQEIKKVGKKPILRIDDDGKVIIMSSQNASAGAVPQQKELPKIVQLRLLLSSNDLSDWRLKKEALSKGQASPDVQALLATTPATELREAPLFREALQRVTGEQRSALQEQISNLQTRYAAKNIHDNLVEANAYYTKARTESPSLNKAAHDLLASLEAILKNQ